MSTCSLGAESSWVSSWMFQRRRGKTTLGVHDGEAEHVACLVRFNSAFPTRVEGKHCVIFVARLNATIMRKNCVGLAVLLVELAVWYVANVFGSDRLMIAICFPQRMRVS